MRRLLPTGLIAVLLATAVSLPLPAPARVPGHEGARAATDSGDPRFIRKAIDTELTGAAFAVAADLDGRGRREVVVSAFGKIQGTSIPNGTIVSYRQRKDRSWRKRTIVPASAGIVWPGEPLVADVDRDGDQDVVVPGGFFVCTIAVRTCGSLTWWERLDTKRPRWRQHTLVAPGAVAFYHRAILRDLDGDGRQDLLTVAETAAHAEVQVFPGIDGPARFSTSPVTLSLGGGSLPILHDADGDGDLDIVSGQYFDRSASFVWFERVVDPNPLQRFGVWTRHVMATGLGGVIQVEHVPGLGLVGSNHTNTTSGPPGTAESGIYLLEPDGDPHLPWRTTLLSSGIVSRADNGAGQQQGAPGVFGYGDVDLDGDRDLVVSGDGDPRLFWLDRVGPKKFVTRVIKPGFGQAGGGAVLRRQGRAEVLFASYDDSSVNLFRLRRRG
ncbi:FG-GAP repeat domain-containing protein [Nocardioides sp.]|uniref:FG-GAP repeat domain-containing protein n=1 Tax=Nocardioides sp. TaxID=35761 RepID=UPI00356130BC